MKTVVVIQARLGSTRFPSKVLADLNGKPMLQHVITRAQQVAGVDAVVVACPATDFDEIEAAVRPAVVHGIDGDEADVLGRFAHVAANIDADIVIRITGDTPLLDPVVSSAVLALFHDQQADFASNDTTISGYPDGYDTEVFTRALLDRANVEATDPHDREHVTPWMKRALGVRQSLLSATSPQPAEKLSVDTVDDLARVEAAAVLARDPALQPGGEPLTSASSEDHDGYGHGV